MQLSRTLSLTRKHLIVPRQPRHCLPLQLVLVDLVGAPDQRVMSRKLSSTGLRAVDISKLQVGPKGGVE